MIHSTHTTIFKRAMCVLIAAASCSSLSVTAAPGKTFCVKTFLSRHYKLALVTAIVAAYAKLAKPTTGEYEVSQKQFESDPKKWLQNVIGWFPKDAKIDDVLEIDGQQVVLYKKGWKGKGVLGFFHTQWKTVSALGGLYFLFKEVDPVCDTLNSFV